MKCRLANSPFKKRRAVSQIIGSLLALGIVTSVGSVLLFNGMKQINAFSYDLSFHDPATNQSFREDLIFENVRFDPLSKNISLSIANIGSTESTITSISVVKIDSQTLLVDRADTNYTIHIDDSSNLPPVTATLTTTNWNSPTYLNSDYKISITTSNGNYFSTIATPFNT
jgi:hypothetical protein